MKDEAAAGATEARMANRLLEEDLKKSKRQYEDAKALMKLFETEADMARAEAEEARHELAEVREELNATKRELNELM